MLRPAGRCLTRGHPLERRAAGLGYLCLALLISGIEGCLPASGSGSDNDGPRQDPASPDVHDGRDADALLRILRDEVVPMYYKRDDFGLPREWIHRIKRAIRTLGWRFSAERMVMDYVTRSYIPAAGGTSSGQPGVL